jgi:hypothetical protein
MAPAWLLREIGRWHRDLDARYGGLLSAAVEPRVRRPKITVCSAARLHAVTQRVNLCAAQWAPGDLFYFDHEVDSHAFFVPLMVTGRHVPLFAMELQCEAPKRKIARGSVINKCR